MCLHTVTKTFSEKETEELIQPQFAYKVVLRNPDGTLSPVISRGFSCLKFPLQTWMTDPNSEEILGTWNFPTIPSYRAGFHSFKTLEGAKNYILLSRGETIYRVKYKRPTAEGTQATCAGMASVIVHRDVFFVNELRLECYGSKAKPVINSCHLGAL
jgi:hypothetical protein